MENFLAVTGILASVDPRAFALPLYPVYARVVVAVLLLVGAHAAARRVLGEVPGGRDQVWPAEHRRPAQPFG